MTVEDFIASVENDTPPGWLTPVLEALWWDARGDWDRAHTIAQDVPTAEGSWVHAYLHRKQGDPGNAGYWYGRAGKPRHGGPLEEEWRELVEALI